MIFYVTSVRPELVLVQVFAKTGHDVLLDHVLVSEPELCNHLRLLAALGSPEGPTVSSAVDLARHPPQVYFDHDTSPQSFLNQPLTMLGNPEFARPVVADLEIMRRVVASPSFGQAVFQQRVYAGQTDQSHTWELETSVYFPSHVFTTARTRVALDTAVSRVSKPFNICTIHTFVVSLAKTTTEYLNSTGEYLNSTGVTEQ